MSNDKKYVWKDYFESRIYGDYSKSHKDILRLVDKELMIKYPNEYPYIHFNWVDISDLYDKYRNEYYGQKSESKKTHNDGKLVIDGVTNAVFSYPIVEYNKVHYKSKPESRYNDYLLDYAVNAINSNSFEMYSSIYPFLYAPIGLKMVHWNKDKDCVYVELVDGRSTVVKRYGDTKDNIYAAVAYALAKIEFETNSNFKKEVDAHLKIKETKKNG